MDNYLYIINDWKISIYVSRQFFFNSYIIVFDLEIINSCCIYWTKKHKGKKESCFVKRQNDSNLYCLDIDDYGPAKSWNFQI